MKFVGKDGYEVSLADAMSTINKDISPIKEIIERKDFSQYSFQDIEETPLSETIPIQVNILEVGQALYFFKKEDFDKDKFVEEVSKLKEMPINTFYDVLTKVRALDEVTSVFNPLFVVYNPIGKFRIYEESFRTLNLKNKAIYISLVENNSVVTKPAVPTESEDNKKKDKPSKEVKESKDNGEGKPTKKFKFKLFNPIPIFKKDKFHFLFALVATFLIGFTLSIGIYNAYGGKLICIFFFICSLAGAFLNFMIYKDALHDNPLKSPFTVLTVCSSMIGLGLSIGGYFIFKVTSKEVLAVEPKFIFILAMIIIVYLISSSAPLLVMYIKKRKK